MRRRLVGLALAVALLVPGIAAADQATYAGYPVVTVNVNGTVLQPDVPAIVVNGRTLLPVRAVAEALGADVQWDQATQTATVNGAFALGAAMSPYKSPSGNTPLDGKSMLCAIVYTDLTQLNQANASNWTGTRKYLVESEYMTSRFPDDSPDSTWAQRWSAVLPIYVSAEDYLFSPTTDTDHQKKLDAGKYLAVSATDQMDAFERDYAAGPGGGKDACGATVQPVTDPWLAVN